MRFRIIFLLLIGCSFLWTNVTAQDKKNVSKSDEDEVIKVDTELIDVPIVVTDRTGKPLLNLKQTNFAVFEDGKQQQLADFSATTAPFEVALLLDTSGSTLADLPLIRRAAQIFIASLRPGDRVSIISYKTDRITGTASAASEVVSPLTDDRLILKAALDKVGTSNGTPYYDSLLQVAEKVFRDAPEDRFRGRRALVALTDGVDSTSVGDFDEAKEILGKSGIVCYFIQVDTQPFFEENLLGDCQTAIRFSTAQIRRYYRTFYPNAKMEKASGFCQLGDFERLDMSKRLYQLANSEMNALAKTSGGKVFPVGDLGGARAAFKSVADEIGTKYSLGYYSSNEKQDGSYRKIKVELKGLPVGAQIRAREGYKAPAN
jgi:VWFA-related protein